MSSIHPLLTRRSRIAVIGAGISGLGAAWALRDVHDVTVFEKRERLGGHANTATIDYEGRSIDVDTGFIIFNPYSYPNLTPFFKHLGVESFRTDMSFGFSLDKRFEWSSNRLRGVFADPANILRPSFLLMLRDIVKFNYHAQIDLKTGALTSLSVHQYLDRLGLGERFRYNYLLPMGAAIWSSTEAEVSDYPAEAFIRFFSNHRLVHVKRVRWHTVKAGSRNYVAKIADDLIAAGVNFAPGAALVKRTDTGVSVRDITGNAHVFDEIILACHSDQALDLLKDADADERNMLGAIPYKTNEVVLHRDPRLIPARKGARAAWTYLRETGTDGAAVTYDMNRLQGIDTNYPLYITLNPVRQPASELIFNRYQYDHPQFTIPGMAAQRIFNRIQGVRHTWFAGAWLGYGFHEDGLRSGLRVALRLGGQIPWSFVEGDITGGFWERARPGELQPAAAVMEG